MVKKLSAENFESEISKNTVLVDFYADWCGPCKMVAPIVEEIAAEREDVSVFKVNVDENPDVAAAYSVMSIPTLIVFKNGELYAKTIGYRPKEALLDMLR